MGIIIFLIIVYFCFKFLGKAAPYVIIASLLVLAWEFLVRYGFYIAILAAIALIFYKIYENKKDKTEAESSNKESIEPKQEHVSAKDETPDEDIVTVQDESTESVLTEKNDKKEPLLLSAFKVAGISHYDIKKAVAFAKKNDLIWSYEGESAKDLKEFPYSEVFETDLSGALSGINFVPEPENEYDKNALRVMITLKEKDFFIGYVPSKSNIEVKKILDEYKDSNDFKIDYEMTGGKYKIADDDEYNPDKLKIYTKTMNIGFNIRFYLKTSTDKSE